MPESDAVQRPRPAAIDADADLALLREAAAGAAAITMSHFGQSPGVRMKAGNSPVSDADIEADQFLKGFLLARRPDYGWLSEETGDDTPDWLGKPAVFVIDPIDGTRAFLAGEATWCISIAVVVDGEAVAGVLDCPASREIFEAAKGRGAFRNGNPIGVSRTSPAGLYLAGPKPIVDRAAPTLPGITRRHGAIPSLAYRIAMVADGRLDGTYMKPSAHDWDIAAAAIILSEAGGTIVTADGIAPALAGRETTHGHLVAAADHALKPMLAALAKAV